MPSTFTTTEKFKAGITENSIKNEVKLRIKAGAISCTYNGSKNDGWLIITVWNVIGEND